MLNPPEYLHVAKEIFENTHCGDNLMTASLKFEE
jgi:hypothetical protein